MQTKLLSLVALTLFLSACGKFSRLDDGGFTKVTFSRSGASRFEALSTMTGGIMIYAYGQDFVTNAKLSDETGTASFNLPNGTYTFYAFGFSVAFGTASLDDEIRCAISGPHDLTGNAQSIALNLKQSSCQYGPFTNDGTFVGSSGTTSTNPGPLFPQIEVVHCGSGATLSSLAVNGNCNSPNYPWTSAHSYKVVLPQYNANKNNGTYASMGTGIESACTNAGSAGTTAGTEYKRIPFGSSSRPWLFPVEFYTYSDSTCGTLLAIHRFHKGLVFGPHPTSSSLADAKQNTGTPNKTRIFLRAE